MGIHADILQHEARIRRGCWLALVAAVLLTAYVGGVSWATRTVEAGVQASIQPLPVLTRDRPGQD
ncbi:MAG: hypothetical protein M3Y70_09785 [Pseudomonadota bacterium]|nr:hypothetical protein [Pseudomonadota bacterium]